MAYAVIRIRGSVGVNSGILTTMKVMRLQRVNHMVILPKNDTVKGMLQKCKDYVTWGEIDQETLELVLKSRLKADGNVQVAEKDLDKYTKGKYKKYSDFAKALLTDEAALKEFEGIKPLFRLSPPKKGYEGIKRSWGMGGALGYRKEEINALIRRMV
jgi:large subunit ribosomal protein L30